MTDEIPVSVAICIPSADTWKAETAAAIQALSLHTMMQGVPVYLFNHRRAMIAASRNDIVAHVRQYDGITHMLWHDSDMAAPPSALLRLLAHDKDIVGAFYNKRRPPYDPLGMFEEELTQEDLAKGGLRKAKFMPGGFVLVKTSAYERLSAPWYHDVIKWPGDSPLKAFLNRFRDEAAIDVDQDLLRHLEFTLSQEGAAAWLEKEREAAMDILSEDYAFTRKARRAQIDVWCDLDLTYELAHIAEIPVIRQRPQFVAGTLYAPEEMLPNRDTNPSKS